ncbi:MAG: peptide transporter substrate-binding protein, partial [Acidimicrobiales bacterium]|nr:peptide transporter substrate-binding protein [Acidimicrobiales bacterium]
HKGIQRRSDETQNVIASCKQAGFDITEDSDTKFNAERLPIGDYDVALFAWVGNPLLSSNTGAYSIGGGANYQAYVNQDVTDLYLKANKDLDEASRLKEMQQVDADILGDVYTIPLFQLSDMPAWSSNLSGPVYNGTQGLTWNANTWTIS